MKRQLYTNIVSSNDVTHIEVVFEIDFVFEREIAAATYKGFYVPEGALLPEEKDAIINSQAYVDYEDFIESVEDLITDFYGLEVYYKNTSQDHSFYFGMIARNEDGSIALDFDFTLRVSNHDPHRSQESQMHKKAQKQKLRGLTNGSDRIRPIRKTIVVNNKKFQSYMDAYLEVDHIVEDAVSKMTRRSQK